MSVLSSTGRAWSFACLMTVVAGCAASLSPQRSAAPASPEQGRAELDELEQQIAHSRVALGLPPRQPAAPGGTHDAAAGGEAPKQAPMEAASESPQAAPGEELAARKEKEKDACAVDPCRYTRAICEAATRICDIARYLGDADAQGRCGRAQGDCSEARRATHDSCPGC